MKTLYVGIDIAKAKFDAAFTIDGIETFAHQVITNDMDGFKKLLKETKKISKNFKTTNVHFCMEATGIYHCGLCEYLQEHSDQIISVVNPIRTKSFSKSLMLRTKNDKVDSSMLAQYAYLHKPPKTPKTPENIKHFRALVRYQNTLVYTRTQEIARLKSSLNKEVQKLIQKKISFIEKQIEEVIESLQNLIKSDEFLSKQIKLLKTIPAIGDKVAWKLLSELKFDSIENISPKAQVAHAGLSPREFSSGACVKSRTHISRMGNAETRRVLFLPALGCIKNPNYFSEFYVRLINNGKPKKVAITAVMRKIVLTASAVIKNQQPFDPNWALKTQQKYKEELMQKIT